MSQEELIANFIHSPQTIMALGFLIDKRIEQLKDQLVTADASRVVGLQVSITELKRFKGIRDIIEKEKHTNG